MHLLETAVIDIAMLAVTGRALAHIPDDPVPAIRKRLRTRLRSELRSALRAYVRVLARSEGGDDDRAWLEACRVAAEARMPRALEQQAALQRLMATQAGSLDGLPAERQDLWRLAHLIVTVREGVDGIVAAQACSEPGVPDARKLTRSLRRSLRRALVAYARGLQRGRPSAKPAALRGRKAARAELEKAAGELAALACLSTMGENRAARFLGVAARRLQDLADDWAATGNFVSVHAPRSALA